MREWWSEKRFITAFQKCKQTGPFFARMHSGTWSDLQVLAHNIGILYTQHGLYLFGSPLFTARQVWSLALL